MTVRHETRKLSKASRHNGQEGFTLIEILVAMVIFLAGMLGIASLTILIVRGNTFSNMLTNATVLAQDKLEELRNIAYNTLSSGSDMPRQNNIEYTRTWNITDGAPATGIRTIKVTVSWQVLGARQHTVELQTLRSSP